MIHLWLREFGSETKEGKNMRKSFLCAPLMFPHFVITGICYTRILKSTTWKVKMLWNSPVIFLQAEEMYMKALALEPNHSTTLCNYGLFLQVRQSVVVSKSEMLSECSKKHNGGRGTL